LTNLNRSTAALALALRLQHTRKIAIPDATDRISFKQTQSLSSTHIIQGLFFVIPAT
jgi:hypothetical protein